MISITISDEIKSVCPDLKVMAISCNVINTPYDASLWQEISAQEEYVRSEYKLEDVNKIRQIYATRQAYKVLGKDPNRYRPSAEALHRRIHRHLPLYQINTLVDLINLISIRSGYSIGGFDAAKIKGDLILGVGKDGESYSGIGRGSLNIERLPVYRDEVGGIGTPTSDEERTKLENETTSLLMIINAYSGIVGLADTEDYAIRLLKEYVLANEIEMVVI